MEAVYVGKNKLTELHLTLSELQLAKSEIQLLYSELHVTVRKYN